VLNLLRTHVSSKLKFNAKIMLFGEYTILHKSDALLIPLSHFYGALDFLSKNETISLNQLESHKSIHNFYNHLQRALPNSEMEKLINLNQLKSDIDKGLYFNSSIPIGYGAGSSGALTAAIFSKYYKKNNDIQKDENLPVLRKKLAFLESYFHGKSSGLDSLTCFLNKGVYVHNDDLKVENVNYTIFHPFIIDTDKARLTGEYVKMYNEKCSNPEYFKIITETVISANNQCINYLKKGDTLNFFPCLKKLSTLQLAYFKEMVLPEYEALWKMGLESDNFYLKLCGAGGGGFILGFTPNINETTKLLDEHNIKIIEV